MGAFKETAEQKAKRLKKEEEEKKKKEQNTITLPTTYTPKDRSKEGNQGNATEETAKEGDNNHVVDAVHSNVIEEPSISDILNSISKREPEENKPKQVSIYLEPDIQEMFVNYGKLEGKGKRSELVNKLLKPALTKYFTELVKTTD